MGNSQTWNVHFIFVGDPEPWLTRGVPSVWEQQNSPGHKDSNLGRRLLYNAGLRKKTSN